MAEAAVFDYVRGDSPLLVSMPHVGVMIPEVMAGKLTATAASLPDTDWDVHRLYDFLPELGASSICARYSRYVVDLNRATSGASLYPGQSVTGLCPTTLFDEQSLYRPGGEPDDAEIAVRVIRYWQPYHAKISSELERIRAKFGFALLWDAHSIRSQVPRFFTGRLPDFNWGTGDGASCEPGLADLLLQSVQQDAAFTTVLNGRFKGGYITRHYSNPADNIHGVQLELSQVTYMEDETRFAYSEIKAQKVKRLLKQLVSVMLDCEAWMKAG